MSAPSANRPASWKWWVCGLLLCASSINYMDRQTLANAAVRITTQFELSQEQYGNLELGFGWAFAVGSLFFGVIVDRFSVRWVYPVALVLWSATGFATGFVEDYNSLLLCRTLLGLFEGGHWPCAVKTTQWLLEPKDRSMGNSVLQSGTSIGAILTPLAMRFIMTEEIGTWRIAFQAIGAIGLFWIVAWFALVRKDDLTGLPPIHPSLSADATQTASIWRVIWSRKMLVTLIVISLINTSWQTLRAWLPKFLQEGRDYSEAGALYFNAAFFVATDIGVLAAGALTLWLYRRGRSVHGARATVFLLCSLLSALMIAVPWLPQGWILLGVFLIVGAGMLGLFPIYHALTQDLSRRHQGKVTGIASVAAWAFAPPAQKFFGRLVDQTGSFDLGFAIAGCLPLAAFLALWLLWEKPGPAPAPVPPI